MEDSHREGPHKVVWRLARSLDRCPAPMVTGDATAPVVKSLGAAAEWARYFAAQPRDVIDSEVNWNVERVLLVSLGHRPTAGWALAAAPVDFAAKVAQQAWEVDSGVLKVRVRSLPPERGVMLAQVMTEPCLLVVLDGAGWRETRLEVLE